MSGLCDCNNCITECTEKPNCQIHARITRRDNGDTIQLPRAEYEALRRDAERLEEKNLELLALLEEAESVLRVAGCTITSDKIADAVCRKECHD
jgi:hypothetical protein